MRARAAVVLTLLALIFGSMAVTAATAHARPHVVVAQGEDDSSEGDGATTEEGDDTQEGQSDPEAETDPGEGDAAVTETGPIWTYQMAKLCLLGLLPLLLFMAFIYWRLVVRRARGEA